MKAKEAIWLKRIQHRLIYTRGWKGPGGRKHRKFRLRKKTVKYMKRYEEAFMDGVDEVPDRPVNGPGQEENAQPFSAGPTPDTPDQLC